ncbi:MAG: hypothetical protein WCC66_00865 [Rhizobiaceae bacterium]
MTESVENKQQAQRESRFDAGEIGDLAGLALLTVFGILPFIAAILLIGFQAWGWISTSLWQSWSLMDGLGTLGETAWIAGPLHNPVLYAILNAVPLSLALAGLAMLTFWLSEKFG